MPPKVGPAGQYCDLTESRGITVYYEISGPTRPDWQGAKEEFLFLLLGSTADLRKTTDQQYVNQASGYFKVLTYDHRNTGRTTIRDEPCTMEDYADDAAALLQAVAGDRAPAYVLGVSFGGMVAQHLAIRHPHLVRKLVLCCCATGGEGGMSFPIHEWYEPGVSTEDRVVRKIFQANTARTEAWRQTAKSEWQMVHTLLMRDEKVGLDEPLRMEGVARQLEARKGHNTWDQIDQLQMDVLCCGSSLDSITPPELVQKMAARIGPRCNVKTDFDWGHAFVAADTAAMPYVSQWLRSGVASADSAPAQVWKVVGGADKGGIIVRQGAETTSPQAEERLATGALVDQLELRGDRLRYRLRRGWGPAEGWVSLRLPGKELLARALASD